MVNDAFRMNPVDGSTIFNLYVMRDEIELTPSYQRAAGIWTLEKKQLLIDSILNGFDIPKLYFHDFYPSKTTGGHRYRYAIIDGKQRLDAIWDFIDGKFSLSDDIELINQPEIDVKGLTYKELGAEQPRIKAAFDARGLSVVGIQTEELELIEELFSRLNEAVPLSAAEKRNALRGPIPAEIRRLARHPYFVQNVPFSNNRYRHFDIACKFLLLVDQEKIVDLKKAYLDEFVIGFRERSKREASSLRDKVEVILDLMATRFVSSDELLSSVGMQTLYFTLYAGIDSKDWTQRVPRELLSRFDAARRSNREIAENDVTGAKYELLEFDRWAQSPNDAVAIDYRFGVMRRWLSRHMRGK